MFTFVKGISRKERKEIFMKNIDRKEFVMTENEISYTIIGAAIDLHRNVGPGLLELAYENALAFDLKEMGLEVKQ